MRLSRPIVLFVLAVCALGMAGGIFETTFNNYLDNVFEVTAQQRGDLELPREFPGLMVAVMAGALFFASEVGLGVVAAAAAGLGMLGLGLVARDASQYTVMLAFTMLWSTGTHLLMPVNQSIALALAGAERTGEKLGWLAAVRSVATAVGCGAVWLNFGVLGGHYPTSFSLGAGMAFVAAVLLLALTRSMPALHRGPRPKAVFRRRYGLYYLLSVLYGARKQVFITFGPWVLIRVFDQPPQTFAKLWIISLTIVVLFMPKIGRLADRFGERTVLMADAALLCVVCLSYGFAQDVLPPTAALLVVCGVYVLDQVLAAVQMVKSLYLHKIAESPKDVSATLSLSVTIDHAVTIPVAMVGGRIWAGLGYRWVFVAAACLALVTMFACSFIRVPQRSGAEAGAGE